MRRVRSASSNCSASRLARVGVAAVLVVISGRWPVGQRLDLTPVRVHASAGWGQPAVRDGSVFFMSKDHRLIAVNDASGTERWSRPLDAGAGTTAGSSVVVSGNTVIAGDGDVFAFDVVDGAPQWRTTDRDGLEAGRFLGAAVGDTIFTGSVAGWLVAWSREDGHERWRFRVGGANVTVFAPVADESLVVATFTDFSASPRSGGVVAVDSANGRLLWRVRFPQTSAVRAASAGGPPSLGSHVVASASTDGTVYFMSRATGQVQWTIDAVGLAPNRDGRGAGAAADEYEDYRVVKLLPSRVLVSSLTGVVMAVDAGTRDTAWRYESPEDGSNGFGFSVGGRFAHVPFASGRVAIIDIGTGQARAIVGHPDVRFDWPPAVAGERAFLTAEDGLYVVDLN